jgi:hypothetical protein
VSRPPIRLLLSTTLGVFALPSLMVAADHIDPATALDRALLDGSPVPAAGSDPRRDGSEIRVGGAGLRLIDVSLGINLAAGGSTATDDQIADLQGGDHDPSRRGFTLQQAELSLSGAVDPYFTANASIVYKTDGVELEEAYATTSALPAGLQIRAGKYFSEFGRTNQQHPHQWAWIDQPVTNTRLFSGDGTRGVGARVAWLMPIPWFSEVSVGMQNADDATMISFLGGETESGIESTVGGRPVVDRMTQSMRDFLYSVRWVNNWEIGDQTMTQLGLSGMFGPNRTGPSATTAIVGTDLLVKWRSPGSGIPSVTWQTEVAERRFHAADGVDIGDPTDGGADDQALAEQTLTDWGLTTQVLIGFYPGWATGVRYEYATGSGDSYALAEGAPGVVLARRDDPTRDDRQRFSPVITYNPTEFSKLRLQYDYDKATSLPDGHAHSVWLGLEILIGTHPAHNY